MVDHFCCCGPCKVHVEKASRAVAKNGFALNIIEAICWFILVNPYETTKTTHWQVLYVLAGTLAVILALSYLSVFFALRIRKPVLFLLFLIVAGVGLFVKFFVVCTIMAPRLFRDDHTEEQNDVLHIIFALMYLVPLIIFVINLWFYSIVFRTYKSVKSAADRARAEENTVPRSEKEKADAEDEELKPSA